MGFYDLAKEERNELVASIKNEIEQDLSKNNYKNFLRYASDNDIYIRKNAYLIVARNYRDSNQNRETIYHLLEKLIHHKSEFVRQTIIYTAGEIGKYFADVGLHFLEQGMDDDHHKVRNAVLSSLKRMGEKNPEPTLEFAKKYLFHPDPRIRREVIHGIELRGRTHPEDVLPLLREVQFEENKKVMDTIIHVLGQISYKEGCLKKVLTGLREWNNQALIHKALKEIIEVHKNYDFSSYSDDEVKELIRSQFEDFVSTKN